MKACWLLALGSFWPLTALAECTEPRDAKGELHGAVTCLFPWKKPDSVTPYVHGKKQGLKKTWDGGPKGQLASEEPYVDDLLEGRARYYDVDTGRVREERDYVRGKRQGAVKQFREDGGLESEQLFRQDKLHGVSKFFYDNGKLRELVTYRDGEREGPFEKYWDSGLPEEKGVLLDGRPEGEQVRYYVNGKPMYVSVYRGGKQHGLFQHFHDNGTLLETHCYQDDKEVLGLNPCQGKSGPEVVKRFYGNGKVHTEVSVEAGRREGPSKVFDTEGRLRSVQLFVADQPQGTFTSFHPNAKPERETPFTRGEKQGLEKTWYASGVQSGETEWSAGRATRVKKFYENGKPSSEQTYSDKGGVIRRYDDAGQLRYEAPYLPSRGSSWGGTSERLHGVVKSFHEDGKVESEATYKDGSLDGLSQSFDLDGKLTEKSTYAKGQLVSRTSYDASGRVLSTEERHVDGSRK